MGTAISAERHAVTQQDLAEAFDAALSAALQGDPVHCCSDRNPDETVETLDAVALAATDGAATGMLVGQARARFAAEIDAPRRPLRGIGCSAEVLPGARLTVTRTWWQ